MSSFVEENAFSSFLALDDFTSETDPHNYFHEKVARLFDLIENHLKIPASDSNILRWRKEADGWAKERAEYELKLQQANREAEELKKKESEILHVGWGAVENGIASKDDYHLAALALQIPQGKQILQIAQQELRRRIKNVFEQNMQVEIVAQGVETLYEEAHQVLTRIKPAKLNELALASIVLVDSGIFPDKKLLQLGLAQTDVERLRREFSSPLDKERREVGNLITNAFGVNHIVIDVTAIAKTAPQAENQASELQIVIIHELGHAIFKLNFSDVTQFYGEGIESEEWGNRSLGIEPSEEAKTREEKFAEDFSTYAFARLNGDEAEAQKPIVSALFNEYFQTEGITKKETRPTGMSGSVYDERLASVRDEYTRKQQALEQITLELQAQSAKQARQSEADASLIAKNERLVDYLRLNDIGQIIATILKKMEIELTAENIELIRNNFMKGQQTSMEEFYNQISRSLNLVQQAPYFSVRKDLVAAFASKASPALFSEYQRHVNSLIQAKLALIATDDSDAFKFKATDNLTDLQKQLFTAEKQLREVEEKILAEAIMRRNQWQTKQKKPLNRLKKAVGL